MERKRTENEKAEPEKAKANEPHTETEAAHRSGQCGTYKPGFGKRSGAPRRDSDKKPNDRGAEYEEGGQYPGKRPGGK